MKSNRSALLSLVLGLAVLGTAACENKTEIIEPDPPIVVSLVPDAVTLEIGESVKLEAIVTGGASGTARTVTFATSNNAVASVDANGNVTAEGEGVATITATATADANARDASVITVTDATGGAEPTISIKSITTGNLNTPVNTQNVFGQIDVTLNVDVPAGSDVTTVETLIDGNVVCSQGFSGGAAGIAVNANPELGTQAEPVEIVCSIQTQAFNSATGAVSFPNGPHALTARLVGEDGTVIATPSTQLIFNNTNFLNVTYAGSKGPATGGNAPRSLAPAGSAWHGGDITFTVLSVNYGATANNVANATIQITSSGNGVNGLAGCTTTGVLATDPTISSTDGGLGGVNFPGCAPASASKTVNATAGAPFTVVFPANATLTAGGVQNVEDIFTIAVNSVTTGGQAGPICINPTPVLNPQGPACGLFFQNPLRVDNLAPRVTILNIIRPNQYYNSTFVPSQGAQGVAAACAANTPCARTVDYGVDLQTATGNTTFQAGPTTATLVDVTAGFGTLPESPVSTTNLFAVTTMDALQNSRQVFATTTNTTVTTNAASATVQKFGIDNTAPTQAVAGPPNNSTNCAVGPSNPTTCSPTPTWTITFTDAGIGPSGFNANPVTVKLERILATGTTCHNPDTGAAISCTTNSGFVADDGIVTLPAGVDGYFRLTAFVTDAAGNQSTQTVILTLEDYTPPVAGGIASPATLVGGTAATFSSALIDNVELGDVLGATVFAGAGVTLVDSRQAIGTYGVDAIVNTSPGTFNIAQFVRSVETTTGAGLPTGAVSPATNFEYAARDVAGVQLNTIVADGCPAAGAADGTTTQNCILRQVDITAAVNLGSNNTFPAFTALNTANGLNALHGLFVHQAPSNATVCTDGSCAVGIPSNTTLSATITGPAATFASPFSRVVFYMLDANGRWTPIGTGSVAVSDNTVLNTRTFTYSFVWTPTGLGDYVAPVVAIGVDGNGSALVSQQQNVTLTTT